MHFTFAAEIAVEHALFCKSGEDIILYRRAGIVKDLQENERIARAPYTILEPKTHSEKESIMDYS